MQVIAHDYETTGVKPKTCGVVQSAIRVAEIHEDGTWSTIAEEEAKHHPGEPIPLGASKIHGVYDADVKDLPDFEESLTQTFEQAINEFSPVAVVGYNSNKFDNVIARRVGLPSNLLEIDLMTAAQRLMARGHLDRARLVDAYEGLTGNAPDNAHDALADLNMTLDLIKPSMELLGIETFSAFVEWLSQPEANGETKMPFGKHKGKKVCEMPKSYLRWLVETADDINDDLKASAREVLNGS